MRLIITGILVLILSVMIRPLQNKEDLQVATPRFIFPETYFHEILFFYPKNIITPLKWEEQPFRQMPAIQSQHKGLSIDTQAFASV